MFYYLDGTVAYLGPNLAVIDCGGVGYACATTSHTLSRLQQGARAKLFTHLNVKEDGVDLFGFYSQNELSAFRQLIGVSGVGPKAALAILSSSTPDQLALAIVTGDEKVLDAAKELKIVVRAGAGYDTPAWKNAPLKSPFLKEWVFFRKPSVLSELDKSAEATIMFST